MKKDSVNFYPQPDRWSLLWLVIGTVLMAFIAGTWALPLAGWLAPIFFIRFMRTRKVLSGFILAVVGLSIAFTVGWWYQNPLPIPAPIFGIIVGLSTGLLFLVDRLLVPRLRGSDGRGLFAATLVFPLLVTAFEFLFYSIMPYGSYGSWAYAQQGNLGLMQIISITGLWGLTFLTGWFASVINWAWEHSFSWPEIRAGVAIYSGILLLVLAYGEIRLLLSTPEQGTVRVHGITEVEESGGKVFDEALALMETDAEAFQRKMAGINELYLAGTMREAQAGAQIVVWPEATVIGLKEDVDALVAKAGEVSRQENIYLAISPVIVYPEEERAELRLFVTDPTGKAVINHLKYAYGMGDPLNEVELQTVDTPYGRLSAVLCGDLDFPSVVKQAGEKGVDILLIPGNETTVADYLWHVRYAPFRAIENGVSLVRQATGGVSIVTDPYGRILASMDHYIADDRVMVAQVPIHRAQTVYATAGDWFGWLAVVGFVVITGWAIFRGRKASANANISTETGTSSQ